MVMVMALCLLLLLQQVWLVLAVRVAERQAKQLQQPPLPLQPRIHLRSGFGFEHGWKARWATQPTKVPKGVAEGRNHCLRWSSCPRVVVEGPHLHRHRCLVSEMGTSQRKVWKGKVMVMTEANGRGM
jgi:hypothetical protein